VFTNPIPKEDEIGRYYQSEEYISHSNTNSGIISRLYHIVRSYTIKNKLRIVSRYVSRGTLLDFGAGTGSFLQYASKSGWNILGVEPDAGARRIAAAGGLNIASSIEELQAAVELKSISAITLWHVLEHVYHLHETIEILSNLLNSSGVVIIAVPNLRSQDARYYGKDWAAFDVPRHLYHFDKTTLTQLMTSHGFLLKEVKPMRFDSYYVSLQSEKYRHGRTRLLPGFFRGLLSNLSARKSGEYSSLIYIFGRS
jgi:2-polyprenyl-3-methyl-5-hydroxy-6-metoxy-1,4-benzoquinol methylase